MASVFSRMATLGTRVGRRIVLLFVVCAMVPAGVLSVVAWRNAHAQMRRESDQRLRRDAKIYAMSMYQQIEQLNGMLTEGARYIAERNQVDSNAVFRERLREGFERVMLRDADGTLRSLAGMAAESLPPLAEGQRTHIATGGTALVFEGSKGRSQIWLVRALDADGNRQLWGDVAAAFMWSTWAQAYEAGSICVLVRDGSPPRPRPVFCPVLSWPTLAASFAPEAASDEDVALPYERDGDQYRGAAWNLFLRHQYAATDWTLIVSEREAVAYAEANTLGTTLGLLAVLTLAAVLWLSSVQIRRTTAPLEALSEGTERLRRGDFSRPVDVTSRDEYAELAASFNSMAGTLQRQLGVLSALDTIDRAALNRREADELLNATISALLTSGDSLRVLIGVLERQDGTAINVVSHHRLLHARETRQVTLSPADRELLLGMTKAYSLTPANPRHAYIWKGDAGATTAVLLPMHDARGPLGVVVLTFSHDVSIDGQMIDDARRLADRLAQGLSNVRLVQRLDALSLGTITAFARAIDANSHWTAGHSERVTEVALAIATQLSFDGHELEMLQRGALLHDIGKIGVSASILDKPGRLDEDELRQMQLHPVLGERILAPIDVFHDVLPLVRSHHEALDGSGYPDGLTASAIPLMVRVLTVSDVYDALVSDRPYRAGLEQTQALEIIRQGVGAKFDRDVVAAFTTVLNERTLDRVYRKGREQGTLLSYDDVTRTRTLEPL